MRPTRLLDALGTMASAVRPPSVCAICRGWGRQRVCAECLARFAAPVSRCRRCALRVPDAQQFCGTCLVDPPPFARAWAAVDYGHPWDALISSFKFHGALDLAGVLAVLLLRAREQAAIRSEVVGARCDGDGDGRGSGDGSGSGHSSDGGDGDGHGGGIGIDSRSGDATAWRLLPVPLSDERLRERGYNQAWELTRRVARAIGAPADAALLLRVRDTPHQLAFPPEERADNVRRAFAVEPRRCDEVRGARLLLVDDVMTTGSTLAEAARVLLRAGAAEVAVWVVARTPRPDGP